MKVELGRKLTAKNIESYRCVGGKPKKGAAFCYRVRGEGTHQTKRHVVEFRVGRKVIGFLGPECRMVYDRKAAYEWDYLNGLAADWGARECLINMNVRSTRDPKAAFARAARKAIQEAARKQKPGTRSR